MDWKDLFIRHPRLQQLNLANNKMHGAIEVSDSIVPNSLDFWSVAENHFDELILGKFDSHNMHLSIYNNPLKKVRFHGDSFRKLKLAIVAEDVGDRVIDQMRSSMVITYLVDRLYALPVQF